MSSACLIPVHLFGNSLANTTLSRKQSDSNSKRLRQAVSQSSVGTTIVKQEVKVGG